MAKCCCAALVWSRVAVLELCSVFVLKPMLITTRIFSLLHRVMAISASHLTRERDGGTQGFGQVTADPN